MNASARQLLPASGNACQVEPTGRDGSRKRFHAIWLRDICGPAGSGDSASGYRKLRPQGR